MSNNVPTVILHLTCVCDHGQNEHHDAPLPLDHWATGRYRIDPEDPSFCDGCVDEKPDAAYHRFEACAAIGLVECGE